MGETCRKQVCSNRVAKLTGLSLLDRAVHAVKQAGAPSEETYARDGFLSWHAETHAVGIGIGVGFGAAAAGELRLFGAAASLLIAGNRGEDVLDTKIAGDIKQEPQYFLAGLVLGGLVGAVTRLVFAYLPEGVGTLA